MEKLTHDFYNRADVLQIARELLGKVLVSRFDGQLTAGRIVEVEAYAGVGDKASHAYGGRHTARTAIMYAAAGHAYVYLCYGIHHLFNIVTNEADIPHAILVRGIAPVEGIPLMLQRSRKAVADHSLGRGPGNVSKALGISTTHTGLSLLGEELYVADDGYVLTAKDIATTARIGVDYAGADALLPYRFAIKGNPYVSGNKKANTSLV